MRTAWRSGVWRDVYDVMVMTSVTDGAGDTVWGAIQTLVAWPESAAMLDLTPDALRTIISTCEGDVKHQAVLLLPAVIARSTV